MADNSYRYELVARESVMQNNGIDLSWFNQLKYVWGLWKKSDGVTRTLHEYFQTTSNPYVSALYITQMCDDFKQAKPNSLCYTVMEEFSKWVRDREDELAHLLTSDVKLNAFYVITRQHNMSLVKMVCSVYKMLEDNEIFIGPIKEFLRNKQYKEACQVATYLKLHDHFSIEDFLIPLVFQDKMNVAEEFLQGSFIHQKQLVLFLDSLLSHRNIGNEVDMLIDKYDIPDAKKPKIMFKPLGKLIARLMKIYNLPRDWAPNLNRKRNEGALQFLVHKRFMQHTLGRDSFREMVYEAITANPNLQREVVTLVNSAGDFQEALFWAKEFDIPRSEWPATVRDLDSGSAFSSQVQENWDENPGLEFHTLSLPDSQIVLVNNPIKFREFLCEVSSAEIVGIDSEWKPQFGTMKNGLALVQVATHYRIYIIDIILTGSDPDCSWEEAGAKLFGNEKIIKLGFGVSSDLSMMLQCLPNLERTVQSKNGYLDLTSLWKRLTKEFNFKFPYAAEETVGESLTYLVELCFGKCLDKSDQFSNWERRPLRESQIRYAALDAYCLLEVFDILKENAERQEIPFQEVCLELMTKTKNEAKKPHKSRRNRRVEGPLEVVCPFNGPVSVSDLKILCDKGLEGLGQQLRKVGIDTVALSSNDSTDRCIQIAKEDQRIVVVRGRSTYAKMSQYVARGYCYPVTSETAHDQVREVVKHFNVRVRQEDIFSRCKLCNGASFVKVSQSTMKILKFPPLTTASPEIVNYDHNYPIDHHDQDDCAEFSSGSDDYSDDDGISPPVKPHQFRPPSKIQKFVQNVDVNLCRTRKGVPIQVNVVPAECINSIPEFNICEVCGRVYWDGSHFERFINGKMKDIICG